MYKCSETLEKSKLLINYSLVAVTFYTFATSKEQNTFPNNDSFRENT
jgi:hypothetical protein